MTLPAKGSPSLLHVIVSWIGAAYLYLVGKTSFTQKWDDPEFLEYRRRKKRAIYAFWHNNQIYLAYAHRGEHVNIMVSRSRDGEYVAQVMKRMRLNAVRGSTSKGGTQAFREMIDLLNQGRQVGFTPDGPKGPVGQVHGGVVTAAQLSGAPIVPTAVTCRRRIVFNSWDKFVLPLPFGRVVLAHGKPFTLDQNMNEAAAKEKVRQALNETSELSDKIERELSGWGASLGGRTLRIFYNIFGFLSIPLWLPLIVMKFGWKRSRTGFLDRLAFGEVPKTNKQRIWFHAASVGEGQALKPLIDQFRELHRFDLFITVSTPEAKRLIARENPDATITLLPADLPGIMHRWIKKVNPHAVCIVETEMWPNLIRILYKRNIPVFVANGRLSARSTRRWKILKPMIQDMMTCISQFYVRSSMDARRFCELGAPYERVQVMGNTKSDNLQVIHKSDRGLERKRVFGFEDGLILVAGSTRQGEEETLLNIYKKLNHSSLKLILAPRRLERIRELEKLAQTNPFTWTLWSQAKKTKSWTTDILIVDTLGDLKNIYRTADMAFIGGTLPKGGGQNPLEPASARLPILFGPSMENFMDEAIEMKKAGAARQARHADDLLDDLKNLAGDEILRESMGEAGANLVLSKQGVAAKTLADIRRQLGI